MATKGNRSNQLADGCGKVTNWQSQIGNPMVVKLQKGETLIRARLWLQPYSDLYSLCGMQSFSSLHLGHLQSFKRFYVDHIILAANHRYLHSELPVLFIIMDIIGIHCLRDSGIYVKVVNNSQPIASQLLCRIIIYRGGWWGRIIFRFFLFVCFLLNFIMLLCKSKLKRI